MGVLQYYWIQFEMVKEPFENIVHVMQQADEVANSQGLDRMEIFIQFPDEHDPKIISISGNNPEKSSSIVRAIESIVSIEVNAFRSLILAAL